MQGRTGAAKAMDGRERPPTRNYAEPETALQGGSVPGQDRRHAKALTAVMPDQEMSLTAVMPDQRSCVWHPENPVGISQPGRIGLDFTREEKSASEAVQSALADVKRAIPNAELIEAAPDFVGLTDIAMLLGFSRQNMRKLAVQANSMFPPPVHEGTPTIWHLATVLDGLKSHGNYEIETTFTTDRLRARMPHRLLSGALHVPPFFGSSDQKPGRFTPDEP